MNFQKNWLTQLTLHRVINLADFRRFLFEAAIHPALIVSYTADPPAVHQHLIEYWVPKVDWTTMQTEVIAIAPADRSFLRLEDVVADLDGLDAPQIWKRRLWGTPRDFRLLDRLSLYPRLRDHIHGSTEHAGGKPWVIAEGFQPLGPNDDPAKAHELQLPSNRFIAARSPQLARIIHEADGGSSRNQDKPLILDMIWSWEPDQPTPTVFSSAMRQKLRISADLQTNWYLS